MRTNSLVAIISTCLTLGALTKGHCQFGPQQTTLEPDGTSIVSESCPNGALDPEEVVTVSFCLKNTGSFSTDNLRGYLTLGNGVVVPGTSKAANYGSLAP